MEWIKIKVEKCIKAPEYGQVEIIRDHWWAVTDDDCILLNARSLSRQCNSNKSITDLLVSIASHPGKRALQLPIVFIPLEREQS